MLNQKADTLTIQHGENFRAGIEAENRTVWGGGGGIRDLVVKGAGNFRGIIRWPFAH